MPTNISFFIVMFRTPFRYAPLPSCFDKTDDWLVRILFCIFCFLLGLCLQCMRRMRVRYHHVHSLIVESKKYIHFLSPKWKHVNLYKRILFSPQDTTGFLDGFFLLFSCYSNRKDWVIFAFSLSLSLFIYFFRSSTWSTTGIKMSSSWNCRKYRYPRKYICIWTNLQHF